MTGYESFQPHELEWTRQKAKRFWDEASHRPAYEQMYFSRMTGKSLLRAVHGERLRVKGKVLDFGCGKGFFLDVLLKNGIPAEGLELSADSVREVVSRLGGQPGFGGVHLVETIPTQLPPESFDVIFLLETIEHLMDDELDSTVAEIHRLCVTGGSVVLTTPNSEDLEAAKVVCADCGAVFHPMQHVRTFDKDELTGTMERAGFRTLVVRPNYFAVDSSIGSRIKAVAYRLMGRTLPHLFYIGIKA